MLRELEVCFSTSLSLSHSVSLSLSTHTHTCCRDLHTHSLTLSFTHTADGKPGRRAAAAVGNAQGHGRVQRQPPEPHVSLNLYLNPYLNPYLYLSLSVEHCVGIAAAQEPKP